MTHSTDSALYAEAFRSDPAVIQAKQQILAALEQHQRELTGIRPPRADRVVSYQECIEAFSQVRGGKLYFPFLGSGFGRGPLVELADGSVKYDFINGIGVHHFGHSNPKIIAAALDAALSDTIMQGNLQQNKDSYVFSEKLLAAANATGAKFDHCFLTSTGVMAGENSMKIAMQKKYPADRVLAFSGCFAGRTMTFSQITDKPGFRVGLPTTLKVDYLPFYDSSEPEESTARTLRALEQHLSRYPGQHAAMIIELIQGEGGFNTATPQFHRAVMEVLKANDIAVLVDEVQTFARTPQMFAFQYYGLEDLVDVVWVGKASQVCATLFRDDYTPKPGLLSQTFTGASTAIAAGTVILDELQSEPYFGDDGKIANLHRHVEQRLSEIAARHPDRLCGPYGIGAMVAFTPLGGDGPRVNEFIQKLFEHGVMSFVAGTHPTRARFLLPVGAVETTDIDVACEIVESTLVSM